MMTRAVSDAATRGRQRMRRSGQTPMSARSRSAIQGGWESATSDALKSGHVVSRASVIEYHSSLYGVRRHAKTTAPTRHAARTTHVHAVRLRGEATSPNNTKRDRGADHRRHDARLVPPMSDVHVVHRQIRVERQRTLRGHRARLGEPSLRPTRA